jgi:hypothetical protein
MISREASRWLILFVLLVTTTLPAQQNDKQEDVSLTVYPDHLTLNVGQTQRFSAEIKGASDPAVIRWAVEEKSGGNISQHGVFTARIFGIYHVIAFATRGDTTLQLAVAKVTVVTQYDGPTFR